MVHPLLGSREHTRKGIGTQYFKTALFLPRSLLDAIV